MFLSRTLFRHWAERIYTYMTIAPPSPFFNLCSHIRMRCFQSWLKFAERCDINEGCVLCRKGCSNNEVNNKWLDGRNPHSSTDESMVFSFSFCELLHHLFFLPFFQSFLLDIGQLMCLANCSGTFACYLQTAEPRTRKQMTLPRDEPASSLTALFQIRLRHRPQRTTPRHRWEPV